MKHNRPLLAKLLLVLAAALIVVPILCYIVLLAAAGSLAVFTLKLFEVPIVLGLLLSTAIVAAYLVQARRYPVTSHKVAAAGFIVVAAACIGLLTVNYMHSQKATETPVITQSQAVSYIEACKIMDIQRQSDGIQLTAYQTSNYGNVTYQVAASSWDTLISAAQTSSKTCSAYPAGWTVAHPTYTWISEAQAQQLLDDCAITDVSGYSGSTNYMNFGAPKGSPTGIAYLNPGSSKELDLTSQAAKELEDAYSQAKTSCSTVVTGDVYDSLTQ